MHFRDVPASKIIGEDYRQAQIRAMLARVLGQNPCFTQTEPIEGLTCSGRILFVEKRPGSVPLPEGLFAETAAEEILKLTMEARYDPPNRSAAKKGWQVRISVIHGKPVAIVLAEWINYN